MSVAGERKKTPKGSLKEKVLQVYDKLFQGQDITQGRAEFWDDFFLLKPNLKCLSAHFEKTSSEDLVRLKPQLNRLFIQCLQTAQYDGHRIRVANAIQTLDCLLSGVHKCRSPNINEELSAILLGPEHVKDFMENYISLCVELVREDKPELLRSLIFNSMMTFASVTSSLNKNPFIPILLDDRIYDLIMNTLINPQLRYYHGVTACRFLGLLLQYTEPDSLNLFQTLIQQTEDELLLNSILSTVALALSEFNLKFGQQRDSSGGILSSFSSFFTTLVSGDVASIISLRPCDSLLLCLYELARSSHHFAILLSYSNGHYTNNSRDLESIIVPDPILDYRILKAISTESMVGYLDPNLVSPGKAVPVSAITNSTTTNTTNNNNGSSINSRSSSPQSLSSLNHSTKSVNCNRLNTISSFSNGQFNSNNISNLNLDMDSLYAPSMEPRNLLADLLEYCSVVMQDVKTPESLNSCHLCLIILCCITQNQLACPLLHDMHTSFKVRIHKSRSRKSDPKTYNAFTSRPIAMVILDLMIEFAHGHLMKKLPHRLYKLCLIVCQNLLCYQKMHKIRLEFDWKSLWTVILSLLKFVLNLDCNNLQLLDALKLMEKSLQIFNFFILHGDKFLQSPDVYDNLYYELIRMHLLVENLYEYSLQHSTSTVMEIKDAASCVVLQLSTLRSIVNHFNAKIASFSTLNNVTSLTENQVLDIVRANYDSLTLRFLEDLDKIEEFESDNEDSIMFHNIIESISKQIRKDCLDSSLDIQNQLHELSSIP
ncbi:unnamed protein product [Schistosoma margrebowiei]|uniref:Armadillo-like helical domain-containing protein n=1 Tax=Schistosoma margrebowiei TaxID=48269 RepID=A0AA85ACE7_9TREM|nr:unnamed protein product [Schistosoma margrebowiei]